MDGWVGGWKSGCTDRRMGKWKMTQNLTMRDTEPHHEFADLVK
jgi:hypothetical protein